jgi:N-methylhydantoinase A
MHATQVAEELGTNRVLIPRHPGNLSAYGLLTSDLKHDYVRTFLARLSALTPEDIAAQFRPLEERAREQLRGDGVAAKDMYFVRSLDLRYLGQAYELSVPLPEDDRSIAAIRRAFEARYLATYGRVSEGEEVQVVNVRLAAYGRVPKPTVQPLTQTGTLDAARLGVRPIYFAGSFWDTPLYERDLLPTGARFAGPAIVEEAGATTVVTPGWTLEVDAFGNLLLTS